MDQLIFGLPMTLLGFLIPGLPLLGALINGSIALACRSGRRPVPRLLVSFIGVVAPLAAFALSLVCFFLFHTPAEGTRIGPLFEWLSVGVVQVPVSLHLDRLSLIMALVITGVGSFIHIYSTGYMSHDAGFVRYFAYLNLFVFAMLILVLGDSLALLFIGWEGVGVCSYLLIGFWFTDPEKAAAGMKAFIVNRIGDFGLLVAMFFIITHLRTQGVNPDEGYLLFSTLQGHEDLLQPVATMIALMLFVAAVGKSAQIPLHVWLPDAMAGPTPVSALIHAATMVTAGVYLVCRMHFLYVMSPVAMQVVAVTGTATAFFAATIAITQNDIKKVLAYSTVSQLGYMFLAAGVGAFSAAIFHLMTHAFFKALLFLGAGSVIHGLHGEQNMDNMGGLRKKMPITFGTMLVATLAICGIFPFAGFFSKDDILWEAFAFDHRILWGFALAAAACTAFYMFRLMGMTFFGQSRMKPDVEEKVHESPWSMTLPLIVLGALSFVGGWVGIPEALKGGHHIKQFLLPLFAHVEILENLEHAHDHGLELILSLVALLVAIHFALFAWIIYSQRLSFAVRVRTRLSGLHRLLVNKYYVDEIYEALIVRPLIWVSDKILWRVGDEKVIDGFLVEGTAQSVGLVGRVLSLFQSGLIQTYALLIALGALVTIAYLMV